MIGTKLYKNNPDDMAQYTATAQWCNANNAHIEDKGEYYEVVENPAPSKEDKIAELDAEYTRQKALLIEQYTDDTLHDDAEAMAADKDEMAALDAWYDEEYQKLESEAE